MQPVQSEFDPTITHSTQFDPQPIRVMHLLSALNVNGL